MILKRDRPKAPLHGAPGRDVQARKVLPSYPHPEENASPLFDAERRGAHGAVSRAPGFPNISFSFGNAVTASARVVADQDRVKSNNQTVKG